MLQVILNLVLLFTPVPCRQKTKKNSVAKSCLCLTTFFPELHLSSSESSLTLLFSLPVDLLFLLLQGYGFQPSYDGDELTCTIRNLHRSTKYKFRVRKP